MRPSLGEDVSNLARVANMRSVDQASEDSIVNNMIIDLDMLAVLMKGGVFCDGNGNWIIEIY